MTYKFIPAPLLLLFLAAYCPGVAAQAITVIGGGADARNCSMAAQYAAKAGRVSRDDLDTCSRAMDYGKLKRGDLAATYVNRGIIATALSRYQDAFADYRQAMKVNPKLPEAYIGRGNIYFLAGKYDQAIEDYGRALDLHISRDHIAYFNRGLAYEKVGDAARAEADYRRALELQPDWQLPKDKLERLLARQK